MHMLTMDSSNEYHHALTTILYHYIVQYEKDMYAFLYC
jgi:hypothetical protein